MKEGTRPCKGRSRWVDAPKYGRDHSRKGFAGGELRP